ncbi:hypothetical protein [Glutamicibacter ardleyensis]|uniref:hypothetical protein n=1 Tax=Glutamicibacter ardleyensis TaxID=225894 RepID=UPI003FD27028
MSVETRIGYSLKCDGGCGTTFPPKDDEITSWESEETVLMLAGASEWLIEDDKQYCQPCGDARYCFDCDQPKSQHADGCATND